MKTIVAAAAATAALVAASGAAAQDWSALAASDLQAIHDSLRDNSPAVYVDRDSKTFRSWVDAGYAQARALPLNKIGPNPQGYLYALRAYTGGFRDPNIHADGNWAPTRPWLAVTWPGFSTAWRNGAYVVAYADPSFKKTPPVGAVLVSCDKKPAEQLARERLDRYEGNLDLQPDRLRTAPYLLWDRSNPFITMPQKCDFMVGKSRQTYPILDAQQFGGGAQDTSRQAAFQAAAPKPLGAGLEPFGQGGFWINLHTFESTDGSETLVTQIDQNQAALRAAPFIVIDLRGADDGYAAAGYRIANRIWDPVYIRSKAPQYGPVAYRVSQANRTYYADLVARLNSDDQYFQQRPRWTQMLAEMDGAMAEGKNLLERDESTPMTETPPPNPVAGRIYVLTDYWCQAACLDMMDLFTALPNVTHIGTATGGDTIFVGPTTNLLPSGQAYLTYGNKAWLTRQRASYAPFTPSQTYTGDLADQAAVKAWVATIAK